MKIDKINLDGKKDSIEVLDKIFSAKINKKLVDNVLYKTNANYKGRHAKTKQQNEIAGSTSKIYAQKGTGGARHASRKAPIFVGGGVAHGPKGQLAYKKRKLNKSEKKLSVASLITEKNKLNYLSEMVMEDMIGDPDNVTSYGGFIKTCSHSLNNGSNLYQKMQDKWRNRLEEKNQIRINNKDKKMPCDNLDTKKIFVNPGTNTSGKVNFFTRKGKQKKYLGVVVK